MRAASVAVAIPCHNHGCYIEETLESVFRQTLRPSEVLVIDDGSTDNSVDAIERAFQKAGPIRCSLTVRENRGISATRNELVAASESEFVAFLDSDDLYAPDRLGRMLECAPRDGLYFAFSGVEFLNELGPDSMDEWQTSYRMKVAQGMALPTAGFALLRSNLAISASNFVMNRRLFDMVGGFDDRIKIYQDWDFAVQALRFIEPTFVPEPLVTYRIHPRNTSRDAHETSAWELDLVIERFCEWIARPTLNERAPTVWNWPRYFRIFAGMNKSRVGRLLAALAPKEHPEKSSTANRARETKAIRDLIAMARAPESIRDVSRTELMMRCQQTWACLS